MSEHKIGRRTSLRLMLASAGMPLACNSQQPQGSVKAIHDPEKPAQPKAPPEPPKDDAGAQKSEDWRTQADKEIKDCGYLPLHKGIPPLPTPEDQKRINAFILLDRTSNGVVWPGAVLRSPSLKTAEYSIIEISPTNRAPFMLTINDLSLQEPGCEIANPSNATVTRAINTLRAGKLTAPAASKLAVTFHNCSEFQFGLHSIGVSAECMFGSALADYKRQAESKRSTVLVRIQVHDFVASVNGLDRPSAVFATHRAFQLAKEKFGPERPPVYVHSVTYGRELWIFVSSDQRYEKLVQTLKTSASIPVLGGTNIKFSMQDIQQKILKGHQVALYAIGGDLSMAAGLLVNPDATKVQEFLQKTANFDPQTSRSSPVSFTVNYLDDEQASVVSSTTVPRSIDVSILGVEYKVHTTRTLEAQGRLQVGCTINKREYKELEWSDVHPNMQLNIGYTADSGPKFRFKAPQEPVPYVPGQQFDILIMVVARPGSKNNSWHGFVLPTLILEEKLPAGKKRVIRLPLGQTPEAVFENNRTPEGGNAQFFHHFQLPELD